MLFTLFYIDVRAVLLLFVKSETSPEYFLSVEKSTHVGNA